MKLTKKEKRDNLEFYSKLFQALELGEKKAESIIIDELFETFEFPGRGNAVKWFARHHPPETIMGWLMHEVEPFARMLEQIYSWLSRIRATAGGNVDQITFNFAALNEQVPFSLESFPKTYIRTWAYEAGLARSFDPQARGYLRVDTPNYWREDIPALYNLSRSPVLHRYLFERLPEQNKYAILTRVQHVIDVLDQNYLRMTTPEDVNAWPLEPNLIFYVRSEEVWQEALAVVRESDDTFEVRNNLDPLFHNGEIVHTKDFIECLEHGAAYLNNAEFPQDVEPILNRDDLESDDTYAILCAYELCFPVQEVTVRTWMDVVDKVLLPFWKYRWRLFEVWSILWMRQALPEPWRPDPRLSARSDSPDAYEWVLSGGDAEHPVASLRKGDHDLSIWFQLKTPLSSEDASCFGQENIEPDVRLRGRKSGNEWDLVILELKDRHLAAGSEEKRVARMYATTDANVVCVANYSPFSSKSLHQKVYKEQINETEVFLVDEFRPGNTPQEIEESIQRTIGSLLGIDVLIDISGSMRAQQINEALDLLMGSGVLIERWFVWSTDFRQVKNRTEATANFGGSTDLKQALTAYDSLNASDLSRALILTDSDGVRQLETLKPLKENTGFLCEDVNEGVNIDAFKEWLSLEVRPSG